MKLKYSFLFFLSLICILKHSTLAQNNLSKVHSTFSELLKLNVQNGNVNYKSLCSDGKLQTYTNELSSIDPARLKTGNEKLAFWINVYNAFTLKIICDNYPVESIIDIGSGGLIVGHLLSTTVWDKEFIVINRKKYSLNEIEHKIIREQFKEPRIHFALVCASISCPPLRNEAFEHEKLDFQLNDQAKTFLNDKSKNIFDLKTRTAKISKVLDWYKDDFAKNDSQLLKYLSKYLPNEIADDLRKYSDKWKIEYLDYNWNLNELK